MAVPQYPQTQTLEHASRVFDLVSRRREAEPQPRAVQAPSSSLPSPAPDPSRRLQAIFNALPSGVVVLDASGRVQACNPAAIELLGEPLSGERWTDIIARAFSPRSDDGHDISLADGRRVSIATCPLGDEPGQLLLLNDVTETRELQQRLSQHQRLSALGEMAAGLAHQVRTPLASGLLYASQLKRPDLDDDSRSELASKVVDQLRQLDALTNDMLLFSRSGYGGEEVVELDDLLSALREAVTAACVERGTELRLVNHCPGARIKGNPRTLLSALLNLANNALQAMGQGGELRLLGREGVSGTLELAIVDTGPGIDAETQKRLFKPFFTTRANGTGLGLAVVQAVAQANGGSVRVESTPGEGSQFIVQLPRLGDGE